MGEAAEDAIDTGEYDDPDQHDCPYCHGTGYDPMCGGPFECEYCDGEGYRWWEI